MAFKLGSLEHAKGFIINKLFEQGRFGNIHLAVEDLPTGYPTHWRGLLRSAIAELKAEGIIQAQRKRTRGGYGEHLYLVRQKLPEARGLLNGYRSAAGLPKLGRDLRTFLPAR